jgi:hypothetical protein
VGVGNDAGNCWHGSLDGTTTIMVRTKSRFNWAALTNASARQGDIGGDLDARSGKWSAKSRAGAPDREGSIAH